jgi:hypothetical protein
LTATLEEFLDDLCPGGCRQPVDLLERVFFGVEIIEDEAGKNALFAGDAVGPVGITHGWEVGSCRMWCRMWIFG